jgi:hypothetical protein
MTELIREASDIDLADQAVLAYHTADEIDPFLDGVRATADADLADVIEQRHNVPLPRLL